MKDIRFTAEHILQSDTNRTAIIPLSEYEALKKISYLYNKLRKNETLINFYDNECDPEYVVITKNEAIKKLKKSFDEQRIERSLDYEKKIRNLTEVNDARIKKMQDVINSLKSERKPEASLEVQKDTRSLWRRILNK